LIRISPNISELRGGYLNKFGFLVLSILYANGATDKMQAMSVQDIKDTENLEYETDTFYRQLKKFVLNSYVGQGAKDGRAHTYYI
ncbi:MAG TPA: hypothetical protein DCE48_13180, partial [Lachnospiraceae bacterium]|nr:hypothetical protein [Lachnospiraceae bacterium]